MTGHRASWPAYYTVVLLLCAAAFISYIDRTNIWRAKSAMHLAPFLSQSYSRWAASWSCTP